MAGSSENHKLAHFRYDLRQPGVMIPRDSLGINRSQKRFKRRNYYPSSFTISSSFVNGPSRIIVMQLAAIIPTFPDVL